MQLLSVEFVSSCRPKTHDKSAHGWRPPDCGEGAGGLRNKTRELPIPSHFCKRRFQLSELRESSRGGECYPASSARRQACGAVKRSQVLSSNLPPVVARFGLSSLGDSHLAVLATEKL